MYVYHCTWEIKRKEVSDVRKLHSLPQFIVGVLSAYAPKRYIESWMELSNLWSNRYFITSPWKNKYHKFKLDNSNINFPNAMNIKVYIEYTYIHTYTVHTYVHRILSYERRWICDEENLIFFQSVLGKGFNVFLFK